MQQLNKPIGILGGTFDPVHFGHLRLALEITEILDLAEVRLIPCCEPVHKQNSMASAKDRLAMLELACAEYKKLKVDDREIVRGPPSYMLPTLQSLRKDFPDTPLCLIMGTDAYLNLDTWYQWEKLLDYAHIIIAVRPGVKFLPNTVLDNLRQEKNLADLQGLYDQKAGSIYLQTITALDITATAIRSQVSAGISPQFLLPESVWQYICQKNLYHADPTDQF